MHKIIAFVLAEVPKVKGGEVFQAKSLQSAPHYFPQAIPQQFIVDKESSKDGHFLIKAYHPNIILVETTAEVESIFSDAAFELREKLIDSCQKIIKKRGGQFESSEEYAIGIVSDYKGDPEQYLQFSPRIAGFLKSEKLVLDENEVAYTLASQIKYAKNDLIIVDWDGAFIFEPTGDVEAIVELLELANLQLLRHRILDDDLDQRLKKISKIMQNIDGGKLVFKRKELANAFKEVLELRSKSILEFDALERELKLVGDWYYARLYDLAAKKFKLSTWRDAIKEKLDSLEDVYTIVSENFSISRLHFLEMIQIILFFVLQAGWLILIVFEFYIIAQGKLPF